MPLPAFGLPDEPRWKYFPNTPRLDGNDEDRRLIGCFPSGPVPQSGCQVDERTTPAAAHAPWDQIGAALPTITTTGNNADTGLSANNPVVPGASSTIRPTSSTRDYISPFTDQWRNGACNTPGLEAGGSPPPGSGTVSGGTDNGDINAAIINLFAGHNHLHDWSYNLGFTEAAFNLQQDNFTKGPGEAGDEDRMLGNAQSAQQGGVASFAGRDAANHTTLPDGQPVSTTSYLWKPYASAYYPPCVDGSFDMSVIGHEYSHATANRMVGGPAAGLSSSVDGQALAIGEGFADAAAVEYLHEYGYAPSHSDDANPFTVGAYISGNGNRGVRNYAMSQSPLNYSNVQGWDGSGGANPSDDGEIWAAVNYDIRQALLAKYPGEVNFDCADGRTAAGACPGNRRWMQLAFDALLLMPANATMIQARDAYLAADAARFGGANQGELWSAFARRGLGQAAVSSGTNDPNPVPSFESPLRSDESTVTFTPSAAGAELFIGDHEANVTPVADADPATPVGDKVNLLPGRYTFVARANGHGAQKFERDIPAASNVALNVVMPANRASGAAVSGDGTGLGALLDDTEETNWEAVDPDSSIAGSQVTVDLAGGPQVVDRVNVSALLRGTDDGDDRDDSNNQNRFTALRQFEIRTCNASGANENCAAAGAFGNAHFTSPANAFPGAAPRPVTPDLNLRSFDISNTTATHVRLTVVHNQCTGVPLFLNNALDNDATHSACTQSNSGGPARTDRTVRAAELQVFSSPLEVNQVNSPKSPAQGGPAPGPGASDPAPVLSGLALTPRRFRLGTRLPRAAATATGTTIRFRLTEPATVTYGFGRARTGRRVGRRCLAPTRARRTRKRCTRYVAAGSIKKSGKAGVNRLRFQGRLTRRRSLRAGSYRLTLTATDSAKQRSRARSISFKLLPRRAR